MKALIGIVLALWIVVVPGLALGQSEADKATARELYVEGQKALEAKDYPRAVDFFQRAEKLYHAPTILLGLARAYAALGKFVESREAYNMVIREKPQEDNDAFRQALEDARREIAPIEGRISWATIRVTGPAEPVVTIDEVAIPAASLGVRRAVNPGDHVVKATAPGYKPAETRFSVAEGASQEVALALEEDPDAVIPGEEDDTKGTLRIVGFAALGVGAAGLIVGGVFGGLAMGKHSDLEEACPGGACPPDQQDNLDSYETFGTVSTVGFIAGGVLAAAGIALVVVSYVGGSDSGGDSASAPRFTAEVGPASVRTTLHF
jgi:hypothetical protein